MTLLLAAIVVCLTLWLSRRHAAAQRLSAYVRGYAQAHDDIYRALMGTPNEAHQRLGREAARQRPRSRLQ